MARPPRLSDADLFALIVELKVHKATLTGTGLRQELKRRFGCRCGTQRIYRLLRARPPPQPSRAADNAAELLSQLTAERDAALARAERAELREQAHQDMWANEIWELRQEVARLRRPRLL